MTTAQVLRAAADLIEKPGAWKQHGGNYRTTFCAAEAIGVAGGGPLPEVAAANRFVATMLGRSIVSWNDAPKRTQAEVVSALRKAADLADASHGGDLT